MSCRDGWGVTVVDALDTAVVMGHTRIVHKMLDHIEKIDFSTTAKPDDSISLFESNIRYLGGLLSGTLPVPVEGGLALANTRQLTIC